ncbi:Similar to Vicia sucrose transport protein (gb/Z93774) [Arabidopsis thaliana]|nr:Similar to Vicia sucrose transport protein (gb/Z93774) [Arabidopsis thaliana]
MATSDQDRRHRVTRNRPPIARPSTSSSRPVVSPPRSKVSKRVLLRVASVACGIQFGWALQLSLLTPYVQELGIPHAWASVIWLCGPLSGLFVQPLVGHSSDRCTSKYGRRRPFIVAGAVAISISVMVIGHAADIGWAFGDREGKIKPRAIVAFVLGFWILDVANNMTQGPCRALLADLTENDNRRTRVANGYFSLFMAVGNVLGYATGSYNGWYKIFTFTKTVACNVECANLKSAFYIDVVFIAITTILSVSAAHEVPLASLASEAHGQTSGTDEAFLSEIFGTFRYFPGNVWIILLVTALTWIGWFPFILFDTDWMGREIYGGEPNIGTSYSAGVSMGALGLMLNSVFLGITSVLMEKLCRKWGAGFVWGISNILMAICFLGMIITSFVASHLGYIGHEQPPASIVFAAVLIFTILGIPLAVIVSVGSGPWDQLFGGGNSPALAVGAATGFIGGIVAILALPRTRIQKPIPLP